MAWPLFLSMFVHRRVNVKDAQENVDGTTGGFSSLLLVYLCFIQYIALLDLRQPEQNIINHCKLSRDFWCRAAQDLMGPSTGGESACSCALAISTSGCLHSQPHGWGPGGSKK